MKAVDFKEIIKIKEEVAEEIETEEADPALVAVDQQRVLEETSHQIDLVGINIQKDLSLQMLKF